jgi:hypothetical protein
VGELLQSVRSALVSAALGLALGGAGCFTEEVSWYEPGADGAGEDAAMDPGDDRATDPTDAAIDESDAASARDVGRGDAVADARTDGGGRDADAGAADALEDPGRDSDAGATDLGGDTPADADAGAEPYGPARYGAGRVQSPLTPFVADNLRAIAARGTGNPDIFSKIGDSITVDRNFFTCLASASVAFPGYEHLADTHAYFRGGDAGGSTPFDRASLAALGGRTASWAMTGGADSPLERELAAVEPQLAVVMFGTNDMGWFPDDMPRMFRWYGENYIQLVDRLIEGGVVPLLTSIPQRTNSAFLNRWVPTVNQFVRGLAQARQIPFIDYHLALSTLPDFGLWSDGVHPDAASSGACDFSAAGLEHGQNTRNLITLEALGRARDALSGASETPDAEVWALPGLGTAASPYVIDALAFSDWRDTRVSGADAFDTYPACSTGQNESGPEVVYRLELATTTRLRAMVLDVGDVDIDLHLLSGSPTAEACVARHDTMVQGTVGPGTYYLVADSYVGSAERSGEYLLVVTTCEPGDTACDGLLD